MPERLAQVKIWLILSGLLAKGDRFKILVVEILNIFLPFYEPYEEKFQNDLTALLNLTLSHGLSRTQAKLDIFGSTQSEI